MQEGDLVDVQEIRLEQHFTEPPPRFSEASLVKTLEEYGIGRPSTYASIITTLVDREYVELESKRFHPTDVGRVVARFLTQHFEQYVNYEFTAQLEDSLDEISRGEKDWVPLMEEFWSTFKQQVDDKMENVSRDEAIQARQLGTDEKSGKPISVRMGRYGPFVQIGTREDEDKPRFAGLRPGQKMDLITLEDALELFKLPRDLGVSPEGEQISANIGRFGPYIKYDSKFVSLKTAEGDDPFTVTLERALELVAEKKEFDANREIKVFADTDIKVLRGRYGPYITDGIKNARIPKDVEDPATLDLQTCQELIEKAPFPKSRRKKAAVKKSAVKKGAAAKKTVKKKTTRKKAVLNFAGVARILQIKNRRPDKGLILLSSRLEYCSPYIDIDGEQRDSLLSPSARPTTWLVNASEACPWWIRGIYPTVAIRICDHPLLQVLCDRLKTPLISTSANRAGRSTVRSALQLRRQFDGELDCIVTGFGTGSGRPSEIKSLAHGATLRSSG